ncbi:hypothetical protein NLX83_38725 [Allokutzneria sp. A3M-2-11 16]|uniref:hypothetical protein n=1 Tax=Allokutzneria sp. A3M-2-11 16 TaxID=2962043 RepID=UPI0020B6964B|nr:hypothetical protein [Allokutzneria sp. A3M-2-11 16]MCP3805216.1 hypothetical protein [Allokutzneria sp. A3M-2-11 16]
MVGGVSRGAVFAVFALALTGCGGPVEVGGPAVPMLPAPTPGVTSSPAPGYAQRNWVAEATPSTLVMAVPAGWPERVGGAFWSDFTDPSKRIRLRVDITGVFGRAPLLGARAMADRHLGRVRGNPGYRLLSERPLPRSSFGDANLEVVYRYLRDGEEIEATYHFTGTSAVTNLELSVHYPMSDRDTALRMLETAEKSAAWLGR